MNGRSLIEEFWERAPEVLTETGAHMGMVGVSVLLAVLIGLPLGVWAAGSPRVRGPILVIVGSLQTIPSIAMLTLFLIAFDLFGKSAAIASLTLYGLLPIVRNTVAGVGSVPGDVVEAAIGIGMTRWQRLRLVEVPLALPVIFAGIRTATVIGVGIATLAAFIGADGLGVFINRGLALRQPNLILVGAIPAAVLAIVLDLGLGLVERQLPASRINRKMENAT